MAFDLKYIQAGELENYVHSEEYRKHGFVPISISRAISHANNPRASKEDIALILAYDKKKLVGYLGIIPEYVFKGNKNVKVCWLSCMWVLPEYRRTGIATYLLSDAHKLYKGFVFITNYIPRSKAAFFKTGHYIEIAKLNGARAYFRFDMANILLRKNPKLKWLKPLLWLGDRIMNSLLSIKLYLILKRLELNYTYEYLDEIDEEAGRFIEATMKDNPFRRSQREFEWIQKYSWVTDTKDKSIEYNSYYFSQYSPDFKQWFVRIRNNSEQTVGIILLTRHKHELKTPYILAGKGAFEDIFLFICQLMIREKIPTLVSYHCDLTEQINRNKRDFILVRPSEYGFIGTEEIKELLNNDLGILFDGDGDGAFT
jgi:GNAT superfamily N-acetyltransferase